MTPGSYKDDFFSYHLQASIQSAKVIIPIVKGFFEPKSVIDIGCGVGTWLSIWEKNGVSDIVGVDGSYVDENDLLIDRKKFHAFDLEKKFVIDKRFELASCLEVAEHISEKSAKSLIASLCALSDVILFSAAIPGQEGTMHVNEQYPKYWISLFAEENYVVIDCIRSKIWLDDTVSWWYRQNILFFVKRDSLNRYDNIKDGVTFTNTNFVDFVHPEYFDYKNQKIMTYERDLDLMNRRILDYEKRMSNFGSLLKFMVKRIFNHNNGI